MRSQALPLAFIGVGVGLLTGAAYWYYAGVYLPTTWPRVEAEVVSSRVINPSGPTAYTAELTFRYQVAGATRERRIVPSWNSSSYDLVRDFVDRYPAGRRLPVGVNPASPDDVAYELEASGMTLAGPAGLAVLGLVFGGIGVAFLRVHNQAEIGRPRSAAELRRMGQELEATSARVFARVGWAFAAIGAVLLGVGAWLLATDWRTLREWPTLEAQVVQSEVVTAAGLSANNYRRMYDARVVFAYTVGGRRYENGTTYGIASSSPADAESRVSDYAPGTRHVIRYRPGDPNVIRFDMDSTIATFAVSGGVVLMGLVFGALGVLVARVAGRPMRATHLA